MTHPLTDKVCDQLTTKLEETHARRFFGVEDCMRSAADWQLEQVVDWVSKFGWYLFEHPCQKHEFISELKKAMRPLHPVREEDN